MRFFPTFLALILATAPAMLRAQDSDLEGQMKILARGLRQLSQQVADPSKAQENMALLESMKKASVASAAIEPRKTSDIPQADREKFLSGYRMQMEKLVGTLGEMEDALKSSQFEKAQSLLGTVKAERKEGHDLYKKD